MRSISDRFSDVFAGKKAPGLNEICNLLNFEEQPVALVDASANSLLFFNSRFMKLVSFSTKDTWKKPLEFIFPELDLKTAFSGEIRELTVNQRDQPPMMVRARLEFIDPNSQLIVIRLLQQAQMTETQTWNQEELFRRLKRIARLSDVAEISQELTRSLENTRELLGVDLVCLYQVDPAYPQLRCIAQAGEGTTFPEILPSTDLVRLDITTFWENGQRVLTELHRFARINNFRMVCSTPLIQGGGAFGLLVAAGSGQKSASLNSESLELLAILLQGYIQQHILVENLDKHIQDLESVQTRRGLTFENMNEGVILLNNDLVIEEINPAAEWMLGYAGWEVKGQAYDNILIGTDRLLPALAEAQQGKITHNIGKATLNRRSGQFFPVQIKVIPMIVDGKVESIELLLVDISEHEQSKALTQQLEHRAVLGDYTAAFAHDVRNPINNISTGLQLLGAKLKADDPNQDIINRMLGDCTRLNHLMESFLAFSRPLELKFEPIPVDQFLKRILDRWQPRFARANVSSILTVDSGVSTMIGDPRSLEQVFTNLISNALEAMTEVGDTMAIKASQVTEANCPKFVEISITDNGPGIPTDILEHIFEPFVTTRQAGTGLGLAISKQIVNAHRGSIRVNSFPGGTVFSIQIPAESGE
ncbi:MAG TPA: ATP-binding protein [Anaerolineaceae bacterium]|nr:ATP-binding protein [Anaerolineaceae bacterium]